MPNVFTVLADVAAAFLLVAGGARPWGSLAVVLAAGVSLYWAGMVLNDLFDLEQDRRERSSRPLAAGRISVGAARRAGWGLLLTGVLLGAASGFVGGNGVAVGGDGGGWMPAAVAAALAFAIVAYDGPLKRTPLAAWAMGGCRFLSFLLGGTAAIAAGATDRDTIPGYLPLIAAGFGLYVAGVTIIGRREAVGIQRGAILTGLAVTLGGVMLMAWTPRLAAADMPWNVDTGRTFPLLIGLVAAPVLGRQARLWWHAEPSRVQSAVRVGVLTIIPLAACFALLGAGPGAGIAVFALMIPSLALASRFRVT